jgi:hypothetical protein
MIRSAVTGAGWKGLVGVGQGFSVNAAKLQAGSGQISGLQDRCEVIAGDVGDALTSMTDLAGYASLASALAGAAGQGAKSFWAMGAAYGHVSSSLSVSATNYSKADQGVAGQAGLILRGLR